jgi:WD40 repeat protein
MSHVFVSYSTKNSEYAYKLADKLRTQGFNVWIDNAELRSSDNWWEAIVLALRSCHAVIVIMTPEAKQSKWVQREVTLADNWNKPTFPVLLAGENWEMFVLTQYEDVRREGGSPPNYIGKLPPRTFYEKLTQYVPRQKTQGADVTGKPEPGMVTIDSSVAEEIARPPDADEIKELVPYLKTCMVTVNEILTRPLVYVILAPLIVGIIVALVQNKLQLLDPPLSTSQATITTIMPTEVSSEMVNTPLVAVEPTQNSANNNPTVPFLTTVTITDVPSTEIPTPTYTLTLRPSETATSIPTPRDTDIATATPTVTLTSSATRTPSPSDTISPSNAGRVSQITTLYNQGRINDIAFTPDGSSLVSVDLDNTIKIWDIATGNVVRSWQQTGVWVIAVSPDGTLIAGGGTDNKIYVWALQTGNSVTTLQGHTAAVSSIDFNPTCSSLLSECEVGLVSGGFDNRVRLWNLETGNSRVLNGHVNPVVVVAFNPNGQSVVSGSSNGAMIEWNVRTQRQISTLRGHSSTVSAIAFSTNCVDLRGLCTFLMASSGDDRRVLLWDALAGQQIDELHNTHTAAIRSLAFNPDGQLLVTGSSDFTGRILDIQNDRELKVLSQHTNFVSVITFSPNGQLIASGSTDETVKLWGLEN